MSRKPEVVDGALPPLPAEKAEEIRAALERVLSSHQFRGSRRCQNLLRHITEQTLAGSTGGLKERTLGVEVFGRPPDYDTSQEPVVRATAAEIRKKLASTTRSLATIRRPGSSCSRGPTSSSSTSTERLTPPPSGPGSASSCSGPAWVWPP